MGEAENITWHLVLPLLHYRGIHFELFSFILLFDYLLIVCDAVHVAYFFKPIKPQSKEVFTVHLFTLFINFLHSKPKYLLLILHLLHLRHLHHRRHLLH